VFVVPVTLAVKESVLAVGTDALAGVILNKTAAAATMVTLAEADLVGSATLVTVTLSVAGEGTLAGGVYSPPAEIEPQFAPLQPAALTAQVTLVLVLPVTVAVNCCGAPAETVATLGNTAIATPVEPETLRVPLLLVVLPALLLTTTANSARLSEAVVGGVVYVEEVAPLTAVPFFCHW
jgi:hypothetical protein